MKKKKILIITDNIDDLEGLINDYFYSYHYRVKSILRLNDSKNTEELKYLLDNKWLSAEKLALKNAMFKIVYKKGKYYFYMLVDEK